MNFNFFFFLKGYKEEMESPEMKPLVPVELVGKGDVLFGNLEEIYTFHNDTFLKDLQNCISTTELVALCFTHRVSSKAHTLVNLKKKK